MIKNIKTSLIALPLLLLGACEEDAATYSNTNPVAEYGEQVSFSSTAVAQSWAAGDAVGITAVGDEFAFNSKWIVDNDTQTLYPNTEQDKIYIESATLSADVTYCTIYPYSKVEAVDGVLSFGYDAISGGLAYNVATSKTTSVEIGDMTDLTASVSFTFKPSSDLGSTLPAGLTATLSGIYSSLELNTASGEFTKSSGSWSDIVVTDEDSTPASKTITLNALATEDLTSMSLSVTDADGLGYYCVIADSTYDSWSAGGTYSYNVEVTDMPVYATADDVTLSAVTSGVVKDYTLDITATVADGKAYDSVAWSSSDETLATVATSTSSNLVGVVSGIAAGEVTITMTMVADGTEIVKTFVVTVLADAIPVDGITITSLSATMGTTMTLTASVTPSYATDPSITWSVESDDDDLVSIVGDQLLPLRAGSATIVATSADGSGIVKTAELVISNSTPATADYYYQAATGEYAWGASSLLSTYKSKSYEVVGVVFYVNSTSSLANVVHIQAPNTKVSWATSANTYASTSIAASNVSNGVATMATAQASDSTFATLPAFAVAHALNDSSIEYANVESTTNIWYLPSATNLVNFCTWIMSYTEYTTTSSVVSVNTLFTNGGRSASIDSFAVGSASMNYWSTYEPAATTARKYYLRTSGDYWYDAQNKSSTTHYVTPILEFEY